MRAVNTDREEERILVDWLILSVLASILWALGTIIDKYILTKHMQDPISYQLLYVATELPVLLVLLVFTNVSSALPWVVLGIAAGLSHYLGLFLYFKAMMIEEASRVISLFYIGPIFTLILAAIVLKENLTSSMYIGVILLVLGAVSISYKRVEGKGTVVSPALGLLLLCSFTLSVYEILTKYVLGSFDLTSFLFWEFAGFIIAAFLTFSHSRIRHSFLTSVKGMSRPVLFWRCVNTYMSLTALILYFAAMSIGLASLVSGATSFEPFFVLVFAILLSYFVPHVLKEDIGRGALAIKALAVTLIVAGAWLIAG
jgi:drug/metabolite transporter (DMT)-like permease